MEKAGKFHLIFRSKRDDTHNLFQFSHSGKQPALPDKVFFRLSLNAKPSYEIPLKQQKILFQLYSALFQAGVFIAKFPSFIIINRKHGTPRRKYLRFFAEKIAFGTGNKTFVRILIV